MKHLHLLCIAVAGAPVAVFAQHATQAVADATAPVAPLQYRSVFTGFQPLRDTAESPDKVWIAANRALSEAGGHMGHGGHAAHDKPATPDQPTTSAKPATSDPHAGHAAKKKGH